MNGDCVIGFDSTGVGGWCITHQRWQCEGGATTVTEDQEKRVENALSRLSTGQQYRFSADEGHEILVMITNETGIHSGRPRYLVVCVTCEVLLHEATTGVFARVEQHCHQWKRRTP